MARESHQAQPITTYLKQRRYQRPHPNERQLRSVWQAANNKARELGWGVV
jgi:hypothetical protein